MTPKTIIQAAAVIGLVASIGGGVVAVEGRYANRTQVTTLVSANAMQIALVRISLAKSSGNKQLVQALCADFQKVHRWLPQICK
mgnify:CR=1 FL=1